MSTADVMLLRAVQEGDLHRVQCLLRSKANPNCRSLSGLTPLHYAAAKGWLPLLEALLLCPDIDANVSAATGAHGEVALRATPITPSYLMDYGDGYIMRGQVGELLDILTLELQRLHPLVGKSVTAMGLDMTLAEVVDVLQKQDKLFSVLLQVIQAYRRMELPEVAAKIAYYTPLQLACACGQTSAAVFLIQCASSLDLDASGPGAAPAWRIAASLRQADTLRAFRRARLPHWLAMLLAMCRAHPEVPSELVELVLSHADGVFGICGAVD
eukprot:EG_transcript_21752